MKKLCIVLTSLILLLFCACSKSNDGNVMTEGSSNTSEIRGSSSKASEIPNSNIESSDAQYWLPQINNELPLNNLLSKNNLSRDETKIYLSYYLPNNASFVRDIVEDINKIIPISFLRKINSTTYYTAFNTVDSGLLYMFFVASLSNPEQNSHFLRYKSSVYSENKLSLSDFVSIKKGSSISDVSKVDSSTNLFLDMNKDQQLATGYSTKHILSDGLLTIYYSFQSDSFIVSDFVFSADYGYTNKASNENTSFHIISSDYIIN